LERKSLKNQYSSLEQMDNLISNPTEENIEQLRKLVIYKDDGTYEKHYISKYAARMFLNRGVVGVRDLRKLFDFADSPLTSTDILSTLFEASHKQFVELLMVGASYKQTYPVITDEVARECHHAVQDIFASCLLKYETFERVINFIQKETMNEGFNLSETGSAMEAFRVLRDSTIKINLEVINGFQELVCQQGLKEEMYQQYLFDNPILIDPLAMDIVPKQKLGIDYITDFVIRKYTDDYILVEIERPDTPIFTQKDDFSAQFTHAIGQVLDFQEWVESNISYAQKHMPNIISPQGLLIIGQKDGLSELQLGKLRRFNINNQGKLRVQTFDSILEDAIRLYKNLTTK
jgi:hypothetical protein